MEIKEVEYSKFKNIDKIKIGLVNLKLYNENWEASVKNREIKTLKRYQQLERVVREAIKRKPDYLIFPELAIPQDWAYEMHQKLLSNKISLITGVEYIHNKDKDKVRNSIVKYLLTDKFGYNSMEYYRQDKVVGAYQEDIDLNRIAGLRVEPSEEFLEKNIYKHGDFLFSCLICNELTDIQNRVNLRGKIDALFILEWNKDINSFNAYVESASLDIHSYIVQVNNRAYGDSRIRAPYKEDFNRNIVQLKGGNHDYVIVGEIDVKSLREFQSNHISPSKLFKPTPTGFEISEDRKKW